MPDGLVIPGGPGFAGSPQPPDVPCDPTGDAWRGPPGPAGPPGPPGSATGTVIATGSTTPRLLEDRAADWQNVKDFGAKLDGTTGVDGPAIGAALTALKPHEAVFFPGGNASIVWGSVQGTTPTIPVHFLADGTTSGGNPMVQAFSRTGKGDLFETYYSGTKYLAIESANADAQGPLRVDFKNAASPGTNGFVSTPIVVNTSDYSGAKTSIWGVHVSFDSYSTQFPTGGWPQHVGISSSVKKHGTSWLAGIHVTAEEDSNRPSSANSALLAMELGHHANGDDDTGLPGTPGVRIGIHLSQSEQLPAGDFTPGVPVLLPAVFGMGYNLDGSTNAITKTAYGVTGVQTYQVFDARTATVPPGYTSPVAALRMDPGQIVDFNGASTATLAGWKGNAGAYLQYRSGKLYYVVAGVDKWSVDASGNMRCAGTVTPSVTP